MTIQTSYNINPGKGYPGLIAHPNEPTIIEAGPLTGTARPGEAALWDRTQHAFKEADISTAAQLAAVIGIFTYRRSELQDSSNDRVNFADGEEVEVCVMGTVWVTAQVALEYGDRLAFSDGANGRWSVAAGFSAAAAPTGAELGGSTGIMGASIVCVSRFPVAAGGLALARVSPGLGIFT